MSYEQIEIESTVEYQIICVLFAELSPNGEILSGNETKILSIATVNEVAVAGEVEVNGTH